MKKDSRRKAIKSLKSEMRGEMMKDLPEMLKDKMAVKVSADNPEDLKEGLEVAEDILEESEELESDGLRALLEEAFANRKKD